MKVGIQLFSVRNHLTEDPVKTLQALAKMGYKYLETEPTHGYPLPGFPKAKDAKKFLEDNDMKVVGMHLSTNPENDPMEEVFDYYADLGIPQIGTTGRFYDNKEDLLKVCEMYNKFGEMGRSRGIVFYYHNHCHEFQYFDGEYVMDILLNNTNPETVKFELDTFWAARGDVDPVEMIDRYKDRLVLLHQKDVAKAYEGRVGVYSSGFVDINKPFTREVYGTIHRGQSDCFAEVGTGIMDIQAIIDAGNKVGVPYILLEQDFTEKDEMESVQISMDAFRKYKGIEWA